MSALLALAQTLDRAGFRRVVAPMASLAYRDRTFAVDPSGFWVNRQPDCTIVSPNISTRSSAHFTAETLDVFGRAYIPHPGDTVVDVGAGVGEEAVVFSRLVGADGRVFAIEAQPTTFACLRSTVQRSGLQNVVPLHCALSEADGFVEIEDVAGSSYLASSIVRGGAKGQQVRARSLDSLVEELGLERVDFLKMNIEGAEKLAIRGMAQSIGRVRNVAISCHDFIADAHGGNFYRTREAVRAFLVEAGFAVSSGEPRPERPYMRDYVYGVR